MEIAILLATYNGEQRLPRLLDSILKQTNTDWVIYAHDDGSSDGTVALLEQFAAENPGKLNILGRDVAHLGAKRNFMWLLESVESDYYMFCDEDDLWLPEKVQVTLEKVQSLEQQNPAKAVCVHTDLAVCDGDYQITHPSLWKLSKVIPQWQEHPDRLLVANCVTGCTMMFNPKARQLAVPMPDFVPMHDVWVAFQTVAVGGVLSHVEKSTILYCQHGGNEVGAVDAGGGYIVNKIKNLKRVWRANVEQYSVAKRLRNISVLKFLSIKLVFEFKRFL